MATNATRRGGQGSVPQDASGARWATPGPASVMGYEKLTVSNVSVGFAAMPVTADSVLLRVETQNIRWRGEGTAPTATDGMLMTTTDVILPLTNLGIDGLNNLKFIRATGADGTLHVIYLRLRG